MLGDLRAQTAVDEVMVVKWFGGHVGSEVVGDEPPGLADSMLDVAKYRGLDDESPSLLVRAAMGGEDRKGDVIESSGWDLSGYRENPVFLWAHDRGRPPIGRALRVLADEKGLVAEIEFAETALAKEIEGLYRTGFMRGVSVGFLPLEVEIRKASQGRRAYHYMRQELLEISAVPVPMHAGALSQKEIGGLLVLDREEASEIVHWLRDLRRHMEWLGE